MPRDMKEPWCYRCAGKGEADPKHRTHACPLHPGDSIFLRPEPPVAAQMRNALAAAEAALLMSQATQSALMKALVAPLISSVLLGVLVLGLDQVVILE